MESMIRDLVDMCYYSRTNNGYNWILVCIDVFRKFVWIKLLKTKAANPVAVTLRQIISDGRKPINLHCDEGTLFINTTFRRYHSKLLQLLSPFN